MSNTIKVYTETEFTYPVFPSFSEAGKTPNDEKALESVDPAPYSFSVGKDQHGNDIMNCIVGIGSVRIHNLYRYNGEGSWRFLALISN